MNSEGTWPYMENVFFLVGLLFSTSLEDKVLVIRNVCFLFNCNVLMLLFVKPESLVEYILPI